MPRSSSRVPLALGCALLMALLVLIGVALWYQPALSEPRQAVAEIPAPPALEVAASFALSSHARACESAVTVTPQSQDAQFTLFPAKPTKTGGPPVELTLAAPGYTSRTLLPGGYPGGSATLPMTPPPYPLIARACFQNLGSGTVLLVGTDEGRTVSRSSPVTVAGRTLPGDIDLGFLQSKPTNIVHQLGEIAEHASNLTDGLLPPVLVWLVAILTFAGAPISIVCAFYVALRDESPAG